MARWIEVADRVLVRRYAELDLSVGLVIGDQQALVIDTRGDHAQGAELSNAVRQVTDLHCHVAITHAHFDHCFGTSAFLPAPVWAHRRCVECLTRTAAAQRDEWVAHYRSAGKVDTARALAATDPVLPDHLMEEQVELDLGNRSATLLHLGRGHTDHDMVVAVPDAGVVFAGDLVEQGAPPDFGDAHPAEWPSTVDSLLRLNAGLVVPGHGEPVDRDFVRTQRDELSTIAELCHAVRNSGLTISDAVQQSPYPAEPTTTALARALSQ